jgi:MOSC domain-containing protein YiiM
MGCSKFRERFGPDALRWVNIRSNRALRLRGLNCRVVEGGEVAVGDAVEVIGRT